MNTLSGVAQVPNFLDDNGTASIATLLLMSHHAFRRDIMRFILAVEQIKNGDASRIEAVRNEWESSYRQALHGHHVMEDTHIFPDIQSKHPELVIVIDQLAEQHHTIDPVLEKGDVAFANLRQPRQAETVLHELRSLLDLHLTFEEASITPSLRDSKDFPVPTNEKEADLYAQGFAWSMQGIAPEVLTEVRKLLPENLVEKLPAAQEEFEKRSERVWGTYVVGSATTPLPKDY
jgi:hypothetical protein